LWLRGSGAESMDVIRRDTPIEELVRALPESVRYLMRKGIQAVACGEPIWGSVRDAAKARGLTDTEIDEIVADLSDLLVAKGAPR
jgi:hypothetical protein